MTRYVGGWPPYGYDTREGQLTPNPQEQQVLRRVAAWHADDVPYRDICRRLTRACVAPRSGGAWYPQQIKRMVQNAVS